MNTKHRAPAPYVLGWVLLALALAAALTSLVWTPYDPVQADPAARLQGSSWRHLMGTDELGRDVLSRVISGSRLTVGVALSAVVLSALLGIPLGILAGMRRGTGRVVMGLSDLLLAFPALLLAIVFTAVFGASEWIVVLAVGIAGIPGFVRVARVGALQVMSQDYILAARMAKVPERTIAVRHVLPNITHLLITQATVAAALAILAEAGLSFLGFGAPAPYASWGRMLQASQAYLAAAPHLAVWPGLAIACTVLGLNLIGGSRDRR